MAESRLELVRKRIASVAFIRVMRIAALDHKPGDDPIPFEARVVGLSFLRTKRAFHQSDKVRNGHGHFAGQQFRDDAAMRCDELRINSVRQLILRRKRRAKKRERHR
jgi:hypothetical protein